MRRTSVVLNAWAHAPDIFSLSVIVHRLNNCRHLLCCPFIIVHSSRICTSSSVLLHALIGWQSNFPQLLCDSCLLPMRSLNGMSKTVSRPDSWKTSRPHCERLQCGHYTVNATQVGKTSSWNWVQLTRTAYIGPFSFSYTKMNISGEENSGDECS